MEGVILLDRAIAAGLRIKVIGDELIIRGPRECVDLVAEIQQHKAEMIAEMVARSGLGTATWSSLSAQRWDNADDSAGVSVPADCWRWDLAKWPIDRWSTWHRRAGDVTPPGADAATIRAAQRQAYDEALAAGRPPLAEEAPVAGRPALTPPEESRSPEMDGFEPVAEAEVPAWAFDDSLTIRTVDVRASIEHHRAQLRAEDRSRPAGRDRPALVGDQGRFPQSIDDHRPEPIANAGPGDPTMEAL